MQTGILLINLGTPDSPEISDVRRYLTEFLTDKRVIELPWLRRQCLVRGVIIPSRVKSSSKSYENIWTAEGSPLLFYGKRVKSLLQESLGEKYHVELGMRYQNPSIVSALEKLLQQQIGHLIVIPMFPQYASATSGSVQEHILTLLSKFRIIPKLTVIDHFYDHPKLISAYCDIAVKYLKNDYDHYLFSFHGLPESHLTKANQSCLKCSDCCRQITQSNAYCYKAQCYATAQAIVKQLQISESKYSITFQSRLGKEPWLSPYTSEAISQRASKGDKKVLVFSPSFVCDCLETLFEIGIEGAHEFKNAGGERLDLVDGLNDHPMWIETLKDIVQKNNIAG